jgi:hypothetical protein
MPEGAVGFALLICAHETGGAPHEPALHVSVAAHAVPHFPQFWALRAVSTQVPPQLVFPGGQQPPPLHTSVPVQTVPHAPQLAPSIFVSTQTSPQRVVPPAHATPHSGLPASPVVHDLPAGQALPHAPQFALSLPRSTQRAPPAASHFVSPDGHTSPHLPALHTSDGAHATPQVPQ